MCRTLALTTLVVSPNMPGLGHVIADLWPFRLDYNEHSE